MTVIFKQFITPRLTKDNMQEAQQDVPECLRMMMKATEEVHIHRVNEVPF